MKEPKIKSTYPVGKLPIEILESLLKKNQALGQRVVIGPGIGSDAAVIDFGDRYLVAKTDPITFVTENIGYYAVNINANDIVCTGAVPKWFLATLLLPANKTEKKLVDSIFRQVSEACKYLGIGLVGGHTEITQGIDSPIVVGQMLGEVEKDKLIRPDSIKIGDLVLMTKKIAIEAVSILARAKEKDLRTEFGKKFVEGAKQFLYNPGISVYNDALLAAEAAFIHAFHDPTEGGLSTGLYELAHSGQVGLEIEKKRILIYPETEKICKFFKLDPLGIIASGSLLIVASSSDAEPVVNYLKKNNIICEIIGKVISPDQGVLLRKKNHTREFPVFSRDEIAKVLD